MRQAGDIRKRLENKAHDYLSRYASTEARLREVLWRFAGRKMGGEDKVRMGDLIDEVVLSCVSRGYVSDAAFAEQKTASLRRSGHSSLAISRKLLQRGVERDVASRAISDYDEDYQQRHEHDADLESALIYARKRRLGPYAGAGSGGREMKEGWERRHYASFARAGFSSAVIKKVMALASPIEAEDLLERGRISK